MFKKGEKVFCLLAEGIIEEKISDRKYLVRFGNDVREVDVVTLSGADAVDGGYRKMAEPLKRLRRTKLNISVKQLYLDYMESINLDPFYQRGPVWTGSQKRDYIEFLFRTGQKIEPKFIKEMGKTGDVMEVLDGKQRLMAVTEFLENGFPIFGGDYWKDFCAKDKAYFLSLDVEYERITVGNFERNLTASEKLELFLIENAKGTRMSQEHLEKIKKLLLV